MAPMKNRRVEDTANPTWRSFTNYLKDVLSNPPEESGAPARPAGKILNRDLSWLHFNDRVLSEAADDTAPALERLKFATIVSSNLDEFFMVRVAELAKRAKRQRGRFMNDESSPARVLSQIRGHVLRQKGFQAA